jgi:hypothetical protein
MHRFSLAAIALLVLPPSIVAAATPTWQPATATSVSAGVNSKSTFVVQAYVSLPQQCYAARIRSSEISMNAHRYFVVEQLPPSSSCTKKTAYKCTVVSSSFPMPIPHKFEVESKGQKSEVTLAMEPPTPIEPMCRKS